MGRLFVLATPIGNLEDVTPRALRVLREVTLIAAEDTRQTARLLRHYGIATPTISYHKLNERARVDSILAVLAGGDVALVSDAGTPGVSDPGEVLVAAAIAAGHTIVPVPGASAVLAALAASGLPTARFTFVGFLPRRAGERRRELTRLAPLDHTLVLFEAPHRLRATLADAAAVLGERRAVAARELTKLHEEIVRGTLGELAVHFDATPPRGEVTLVVAAADVVAAAEPAAFDEAAIASALRAELARGLKPRQAAAAVARGLGRPPREIYRFLIDLKPSASI